MPWCTKTSDPTMSAIAWGIASTSSSPGRPCALKAFPHTMLIGDMSAHRHSTWVAATAGRHCGPKATSVSGSASVIRIAVSGSATNAV